MRGRFIVFEGIDASGKTTQARLLARELKRRGRRVLLLREPGATGVGERIRRLLLGSRNHMTMECELFLLMAARAQLVREKILPALRRGIDVVCDRYLYSSIAYQGVAGGLGFSKVLQIGKLAIGDAVPDRVFVLDLAVRQAQRRAKGLDRIERRDLRYHERVRRGFLQVARRLGARARVLAADRPVESIQAGIRRALGL